MIPIKSKNTKKTALIFLILLLIVSLSPDKANANAAETLVRFATDALSAPFVALLELIKNALSAILSNAIIPILNAVMGFNNFFTEGVNLGWKVTRDFANLFFALVLLLIAVATVLNIGPLDNYTAKRILPNFIMVALFINFSKAIVGFLIDISQIIMIELWNSVGDKGIEDAVMRASNLAKASNLSGLDTLALNLVIIILIIIFIAIFIWTIVIFIVRIANLWIAIILSPLAFMSFLIPGLREIYNTWIKLLQSALVTGPVLMFMLYLSVMIMNNGFPQMADPSSNLLENGSLYTYILVAILLFASNAIATKAGMEAPPLLQKAAGIATTVATFGAGAYVGVGGYNTNQLRKKTLELGDKGIGGVTRGVQVLTGGKINPNDRYEMWKEQNKSNVEKGKAFGGGYFGAVAQQTLGGEAGRKANFNRTQLNMAEEARLNETLDSNPALQKALAAEEARILENYKGEEDADKVIADIDAAVQKGDLVTARALKTHLNSLGEINKLLNQNSPFSDIAKQYATEADQLAAFDRNVLKIGASKYDKSYQVRNRNIAKSKKGMEGFAATPSSTLTIGAVNNPTTSDLFQDYKNGSISENAKKFSDNLFSRRKKNLATNEFTFDGNGNSEYEFDINAFDDFVSSRSMNELENPDTWKSMNQSLKTVIINGLRNSGLQKNDPGNTAAAWRGIEQ